MFYLKQYIQEALWLSGRGLVLRPRETIYLLSCINNDLKGQLLYGNLIKNFHHGFFSAFLYLYHINLVWVGYIVFTVSVSPSVLSCKLMFIL